MRRRWIVGLIAGLAVLLAGRAVTLAQKNAKVWGRPSLQAEPKSARRQGNFPIVSSPTDDPADLPSPRTTPPADGDDPMNAIEAFIGRGRKEADESIKALSAEAKSLRARLRKVESALTRWQGVAQALNQDGAPRTVEGGPGLPTQPEPILSPIPPPPSDDPVALPPSDSGGLPPPAEPGATPPPSDPGGLPPPAEPVATPPPAIPTPG